MYVIGNSFHASLTISAKMLLRNIVVWFCVLFCSFCHAANILAVMPIPSYSHQIVFRPLWKELSLRGHNVTLLTTDPMNDSALINITEVNWHFAYDLWNVKHKSGEMMRDYQTDLLSVAGLFIDMMNDITEQELSHPQVKQLIRDPQTKFDLLIVENIYPSMIALSERFKCPYISVAPLDVLGIVHEAVGNPTNPALYPDFMVPFTGTLNFFERLVSSLFWIWIRYFFRTTIYPNVDVIMKRHLGDDIPSAYEINKKVSMLFINVNPVLHNIRPLVPTTIHFGGPTHIQKTSKSLPTELQKYLDEAPYGVIYFSLGTNVKSKDLSPRLLKDIISVFSELPYKVLWKYENDSSLPIPSNIKMQKWMPQQDVLRHKNIKLFITQGGQQSMEEAIYFGVPLLAIPFFGDQQANVDSMVSKGLGLSLDHHNIEKDMFKSTIIEIITNKKYKENVIAASKILTDNLMSGLDLAVWWTEYVIRHNGTQHLRSSTIDIPFYEYFYLDVLLFLVVASALLCYVIYYLCIKQLVRCLKTYVSTKRIYFMK